MSKARNIADLLDANGDVKKVNLDNAAGGGNSYDFVASGTIPNGAKVILKSDGTVEVVSETTVPKNIPYTSDTANDIDVSHDYATRTTTVAYNPNDVNEFVALYRIKDTHHTTGAAYEEWVAVVCTINGASITVSSPVTVSTHSNYLLNDTQLEPIPGATDKYLMITSDDHLSFAKILTVSGTTTRTVSVGSAYNFDVADPNTYWGPYKFDMTFDPNDSSKFVVVNASAAEGNHAVATVGQISGTTITFGSTVTFKAEDAWPGVGVAITGGKVIVSYCNASSQIGLKLGTISGTSISFGSETLLETDVNDYSEYPTLFADPVTDGQFVLGYGDWMNPTGVGVARLCSISGNTFTIGSEVVFFSRAEVTYITNNTEFLELNQFRANPNNPGEFIVSFENRSGSSNTNKHGGYVTVGTISNGTLSFDSESKLRDTNSLNQYVSMHPSGKFVVIYIDNDKDLSSSERFRSRVTLGQLSYNISNLTADNFIGTSTAAYSDGDTATISLANGISDNQSGLTIGSDYYVQPDGTLSTTAGDPSIKLGTAISSTAVLLTRG